MRRECLAGDQIGAEGEWLVTELQMEEGKEQSVKASWGRGYEQQTPDEVH